VDPTPIKKQAKIKTLRKAKTKLTTNSPPFLFLFSSVIAMDVHHHHQSYAQSVGHPPAYDPSHSYDAYYASYPQPHYDASAYHHQYYDYSASYQQPPPPGVDHAHHRYMAAPPTDGMEAAAFHHPSEYAVTMDVAPGNGGLAQVYFRSFLLFSFFFELLHVEVFDLLHSY
jgi:hypothetical protein